MIAVLIIIAVMAVAFAAFVSWDQEGSSAPVQRQPVPSSWDAFKRKEDTLHQMREAARKLPK